MTRTAFMRLLKIAGTALAIILIVIFAIWRSLNYAKGPHITVTEPANGASISTKSVTIKGQILRAKSLVLNGSEITIDEQGDFVETIVVFPGLNVITLIAKDQFGRSVEDQLTLLGTN